MYKLLYKNHIVTISLSIIVFIIISWQFLTSDTPIGQGQLINPLVLHFDNALNMYYLKKAILFLFVILTIGFLMSIQIGYLKISNTFTFLPTLLFYIFISFLFRFKIEFESIYILLFLVISNFVFINLLNTKIRMRHFYAIGYMFSMALVFNFQFVIFFIPIMILIFRFESNGWKDILALFLGVLLILYFLFSWLYLKDSLYIFGLFMKSFTQSGFLFVFEKFIGFAVFFILIWILFTYKSQALTITNRNIFFIQYLYFLFAIIYAVLFSTKNYSAAMPLVYLGTVFFASNIILTKSPKYKNIYLILLFIAFITNIILTN